MKLSELTIRFPIKDLVKNAYGKIVGLEWNRKTTKNWIEAQEKISKLPEGEIKQLEKAHNKVKATQDNYNNGDKWFEWDADADDVNDTFNSNLNNIIARSGGKLTIEEASAFLFGPPPQQYLEQAIHDMQDEGISVSEEIQELIEEEGGGDIWDIILAVGGITAASILGSKIFQKFKQKKGNKIDNQDDYNRFSAKAKSKGIDRVIKKLVRIRQNLIDRGNEKQAKEIDEKIQTLQNEKKRLRKQR